EAPRERWNELAPSLRAKQSGALLWIIVGDWRRAEQKYGERAHRLLTLEAGHLMQNLCLLSESLGLSTIPLGGFLESDIANEIKLRPDDAVLYVGLCGNPG